MSKTVELVCPKCKLNYTVTKSTYYRRIQFNTPDLCKECLKIHNGELVKKRFENMSDEERIKFSNTCRNASWNSKSEEDKQKIIEKRKKFWEDNPEKLKEKNSKIGKGIKQFLNNLSDEDYEKFMYERGIKHSNSLSDETRKRLSELMKKNMGEYYKNLSDEEREEIQNKKRKTFENLSQEEKDRRSKMFSTIIKDRWDNLSEDERLEISKNISNGVQSYWDNMSDEERFTFGQKQKEIWEKRTQEEFEEWSIKTLTGVKESYEKNRIINNKLEKEFKEFLDSANIPNEYLYINKKKYPGFNEIFPNNPITGGRVSPYHNWDFIVFNSLGNKLIDIDGSIHNENKEERQYVKFNDSQRVYQTDDLDAYIIKAYKDLLNDDTEVYRFNKEKNDFIFYKYYKEFINELISISIMDTK